MITPYHAQYFAHQLTRKWASDRVEKLSQSLFNATVDLNPHQLDAALFAFRSPLSRGAIRANEVGLGKTIEAGLIISQLWAQRKRRILCILPAALRGVLHRLRRLAMMARRAAHEGRGAESTSRGPGVAV